MDTKPSKENGSDTPSSQSAGRIAQRSRLGRTLLFAGVFALLAMVFVPMPTRHGGGYRLIFDLSDTNIAFVQLLVNVAFAALAGAIVANLSKRVLYVIGACIAVVAVGVGVFAMIMADRGRINQGAAPEVSPSPTPVGGIGLGAFLKKHSSPVEAADLRKIILFDVTYNKVEDDKLGFIPSNPFQVELPRIKGRLRNELPRKISYLKLTILFFNSDGKLIETEPVEIYGDFYPGGPTSFSGIMSRVLNLPEGWTWKVTVSDASYTKDEN
jgi:hypothetical protein